MTEPEVGEESLHPNKPIKGRFHDMPDYVFEHPRPTTPSDDEEFQLDNPMVSNIEKLAQKRGTNTAEERFKVTPDYAYPNTKMNREELRREMNKKSFFYHNLRLPSEPKGVGQVALEIMQCFGLPKPDKTLGSEASAFVIAVCGPHAFRTDTMPPVANPMWLSRMRRACLFPVYHAYARVFVGVFGQNSDTRRDGFAGRIVLDIARLRPNCTYDITLPLRQSAQVYSRDQRGAIRVRIHLHWYSEQKAILSYLPKKIPKIAPNEDVTVNCCDAKAFQNVARLVHGEHLPGRFNTKHFRATIKEVQLTQIFLLRYLRKREIRNLRQWRVPIVSAFFFGAWMHCIYRASVKYVPGHLVTFLLLYLWKNYAYYYLLERSVQNGFTGPSWEELFLALIFGRPNTISPLEMKSKDSHEKCVMDDIAQASRTASGDLSLADIARVFMSEIRLHTGRHKMRIYQNVFNGSEAVDFLVNRGYAETRQIAVALGQQFISDLKLFTGVVNTFDFNDDSSLYFFPNYDPNRSVIKTHKPFGKRLCRLLGLIPPVDPTFSEAGLEMPFANGIDHPRLTVKESLVIRSKESMKLMMEEEQDLGSDDGKSHSQQIAAGLNALLDEDDKTDNTKSTDDMELETEEDPKVEIKILNKPPQQDINFRAPKSGKPLVEVLAEARHKVHGLLLHAFNDRVYPKPMRATTKTTQSPRRKLGKGRIRKFLNRKFNSSSDEKAPERGNDPKEVQDEHDKLLGAGKYSHSNPMISRVGVLVQPIVEMVLEGLCLFRALFNVFTWRDPMLTFWVSLIGPVLVIVLHYFPWRLVLGITGVVLFGPQNWLIRLRREWKNGPDEFEPNIIVKKRKKPQLPAEGEAPLFSMYAPDNQPIPNHDIDDSNVRKVVVPYSPLMYQRFYDFPPETEYAKVIAEGPPTDGQLDPSRLASDKSVDASTNSHSTEDSSSPFRIFRKGTRLRRRQNTMSSEDDNRST